MGSRLRLGPQRQALLVAVLTACAAVGCEFPADWGSSSEPRTVSVGDTFAIDEGTRVRLGRRGPLLSFEGVPDDSRCPAGVHCVWEGQADSQFHLRGRGLDTTFVLTIPGLVETPFDSNDRVAVQHLEFLLLELKPYPDADAPASAGSPYRALLTVAER